MKHLNKIFFIFSWVAMLTIAASAIYLTTEENKSYETKGWGVASIEKPSALELQQLLPGDRILLNKREDIDEDKMAFPSRMTFRLLYKQKPQTYLGLISNYGKEVRVYDVDIVDDIYPIAIKIAGSKVWIESEMVAEITYVKKLKEPRIIRRSYERIKQMRA